MRTASFLAAFLFVAAAMAPITAGTTAPSTRQSAQSRTAQCDAERKACLASKARTGSFGAQYVAPDDVAACQEAYRICTGH
jgi:hypothetical protein